ncbi:MAG TPA: DUF924 family protein [Gemmataceae bacterium]|nr:DUF924 family protein [Gemmataceae bacterium]
MDYQRVIDFWFVEIKPAQWWGDDADLDHLIARKFGAMHGRALRCELYTWRVHPLGRLAEIIVLDQFSRNIYRGTAQAFAADPLALALAQEAVATNAAPTLEPRHRAFLYMPYMHSESREIHEIAVRLFSEYGLEGSLDSELKHKAIIDRFGRYPHRNSILGRISNEEESEFVRNARPSF